jgi:hypothetical protein
VVVGDLGSLYRWDPARLVWDSLFDRRLAVKLDAARLVAFDTGEAWAVGGGKLWHFTGGAWNAENLPATPRLAQVTAVGLIDGRVVVGGQADLGVAPLPASKGAVLVRSTGGVADGGVELVSWTSQPLRGPQVPRGLFGSGQEGWLVGDFGALWSWRAASGAFVEESHGFYGDVADLAVLPADTYAAVNECTTLTCLRRTGQVMHAGSDGQWAPLGTFPSAEELLAVAAASPGEVLASTPSAVFRWDGAAWGTVPVSGFVGPIIDLQYCGAAVWGAGVGGAVYRGTAAALSFLAPLSGLGPLTALHCPSEGRVWAAGDGFLAERASSGEWSSKSSATVTQAAWKATWSPGPGEGFAFGDARYGVYFDSVDLVAQESLAVPVDVVTGMWGATIDTLTMVGLTQLPLVTGFALRFDGVTWRQVDSGARRKATAIHGSDPLNVWIGTEGGGVLKAVAPP